MPSTFFGLNIARTGMSTYNVWLNTTAHNISNVKTVGYTRQTVNQVAGKPISFGTRYGMVGSVRKQSALRVSGTFIMMQSTA